MYTKADSRATREVDMACVYACTRRETEKQNKKKT